MRQHGLAKSKPTNEGIAVIKQLCTEGGLQGTIFLAELLSAEGKQFAHIGAGHGPLKDFSILSKETAKAKEGMPGLHEVLWQLEKDGTPAVIGSNTVAELIGKRLPNPEKLYRVVNQY